MVRDLRPWLLRVVYHQFVDEHRKQQRAKRMASTVDPLTLVDPADGPERQFEAVEDATRVRRALAGLNEDQRLLVGLHLLDGYTLEEVAQTLDVPIGTLKSRLHRAKGHLKKILRLEPFSSSDRVDEHELP
jgi:RNA polymerase sigma-70 factor (ECF subfamily)